MRYEDGLASLYTFERLAGLDLMVMSHLAGFNDRIPAWLSRAQQEDDPRLAVTDLQRVFAALLAGDVGAIEASLRTADFDNMNFPLWVMFLSRGTSGDERLDRALSLVAVPLVLLGRGDILADLHDNSLRRMGAGAKSAITMHAAVALAQAGDWDHALRILENARASSGDISLISPQEKWLWQHAYLQGRMDVLPQLAAMPFQAVLTELAERRGWLVKAHQIRAGVRGVDVPVIEEDQPNGYLQAAAMQIAALADDAAQADYVRELRRVVKARTFRITVPQRGLDMTVTDPPPAFSEAEVQIAVRRKNYVKAAELARVRVPRNVLLDPPDVVINAFLEEGDWRAAAAIAAEHDPRARPARPWFEDTRLSEYVNLQCLLATAAAWSGDDAAASEFLRKAKDAARPRRRKQGDEAVDGRFIWLETLLAGVAEGKLPRKVLHVLTPAFRN